MASIIPNLIPALWAAWLIYWFVASRNVKQARWHESILSQLLHRVPFLLAVILIASPSQLPPFLMRPILPHNPLIEVAGTVAVAAGLGFAAWARAHLGRNWSAAVTVKEGHTLIRTGPYRYVRHPIYSGLLLALLGTAVAIGEWRGFAGAAVALAGIGWKVLVEERRMRETFPEYEQYRHETAALVPFVV